MSTIIKIIFIVLFFSVNAFALNNIESLGKKIFNDENLSLHENQSCKTCHNPRRGFVDPDNVFDPLNSVVSTGSDGISVGSRNTPTAAYAGFSPVFHYDETVGGYVGGLFWDGRATGHTLLDPLAEQSQAPFLNPVEMALSSPSDVINIIKNSCYSGLFQCVFPGTDFSNIPETYDNMAIAIAAFERSPRVNIFTSRFDKFWKACNVSGIDISLVDMSTDLSTLPQNILSTSQLKGLALFNDQSKGNCAACHPTKDYVYNGTVFPPLFTDFTYDNIGIPKSLNPAISGNPIDYGLGGRSDISDPNQLGKFKVSTLRNISKTRPYGHNGFFPTLENIVNFYNTRDVLPWPNPEVAQNVNTEEMGNLGLTETEEHLIIVFLKSLTD